MKSVSRHQNHQSRSFPKFLSFQNIAASFQLSRNFSLCACVYVAGVFRDSVNPCRGCFETRPTRRDPRIRPFVRLPWHCLPRIRSATNLGNPARHLSPSATNSCTRTTNRGAAAAVKYLHALNRARYSGHSIIWNKSRPFPSIEGNSDRNLFQVLKKFWKMDRLCSLCLSKWAHVCKWAVERRRKVEVLIIFLKPLLKIINNVTDAIEIIRGLRNF